MAEETERNERNDALPEQQELPEQREKPARKGHPHGRRKTRREGHVSPFGEVLTDYMARKRPIWSTGRMSRELNVNRQTIGNWVYHDITPPVETILPILAKLGIPLTELIEAYRRRGVEIPALAPEPIGGDIERRAITASGSDERDERDERRAMEREAEAEARREAEREAARQREWQAMIEQTRAVMLATGFPEPALDALLANLEAQRAGGEPPSAMRRFIESEHRSERQDEPARTERTDVTNQADRPDTRRITSISGPKTNRLRE